MSSTNLPPVPPITSAGLNDPVWAKWFRSLQARAAVSSTAISITAGGSLTSASSTAPDGTTTISLTLTPAGVLKSQGGHFVQAAFATAQSIATQTSVAGADSTVAFPSLGAAASVSLISNTFTVAQTGAFAVALALHLSNTGSSTDTVAVWLKVAGAVLAGSGAATSVPATYTATLSASTTITVVAGQTITVHWTTTTGNSSLTSVTVGPSATVPSASLVLSPLS